MRLNERFTRDALSGSFNIKGLASVLALIKDGFIREGSLVKGHQ